jgi:hypothetical protein
MTKEAQSPKPETQASVELPGIRHSVFGFHSSFVIRHSDFACRAAKLHTDF